jgi:hypothetical protein
MAGLLLLIPLVVVAQPGLTYLELEDPIRDPIPADCSTWHELYPNFCAPRHQSGYEDNGDGIVSACDYIYLDGERYHIEWAGPTYTLDQAWYEPLEWWEPGNPYCQEWIEIYPDHGVIHHVTDWEDGDQSGDVSPCDMIMFEDGTWWHVADVSLNIRVVPDGSPAEQGTWSKVKSLFSRLF